MKWWRPSSNWGDEVMSYDTISKAIDRSMGEPAAMAHWGGIAVHHPDVRASPVLWPAANLVFGRGLRESAKGNAQELARARKAFEDACEGYERTENQESLAMSLHELGLLLGSNEFPGDPVQNLEQSLACHRRSLELSADEEGRAIAAYEVGRCLSRRTSGDLAQNIEAAIVNLETAARLYDTLRWPFYRADALALLVECYEKRVRGTRRDNLESAIEKCTAALDLCDEQSGWNEWLSTSQTLGRLYTRRVAETQGESDERALEILHRAHVPDGAVDTTVLIVSELVTNAIRHCDRRHLVQLRVIDNGNSLLVEVDDPNTRHPRPVIAAPDAEGGRGLLLVRAIAAEFGARRREPIGKTVWATVEAGDRAW